MKGKWNGVVLVETGKDTNNTLIVVAFVVCDKENAANYSFLLSEMKKNPHLKELLEDPLTILYTDEHKGSKAAIEREAKPTIHRLCLKHLAGNFPGPGIGEVIELSYMTVACCCRKLAFPGMSLLVPLVDRRWGSCRLCSHQVNRENERRYPWHTASVGVAIRWLM